MQTKDGYLMVGATGEAIWLRCAKALGHPEWCEAPRFATNQQRMTNREALEAVMNAVLTTKTTSDWVEVLETAGVPCGPVYDYAQMFADSQVRHRGMVQYASDPELGEGQRGGTGPARRERHIVIVSGTLSASGVCRTLSAAHSRVAASRRKRLFTTRCPECRSSSRIDSPLNKPREIPIIFSLQLRLSPISAGDQPAAGLAAAPALHFVWLVIGHRVVNGQLLIGGYVPHRDEDNLALQS
jgi:hypothetical protein